MPIIKGATQKHWSPAITLLGYSTTHGFFHHPQRLVSAGLEMFTLCNSMFILLFKQQKLAAPHHHRPSHLFHTLFSPYDFPPSISSPESLIWVFRQFMRSPHVGCSKWHEAVEHQTWHVSILCPLISHICSILLSWVFAFCGPRVVLSIQILLHTHHNAIWDENGIGNQESNTACLSLLQHLLSWFSAFCSFWTSFSSIACG